MLLVVPKLERVVAAPKVMPLVEPALMVTAEAALEELPMVTWSEALAAVAILTVLVPEALVLLEPMEMVWVLAPEPLPIWMPPEAPPVEPVCRMMAAAAVPPCKAKVEVVLVALPIVIV